MKTHIYFVFITLLANNFVSQAMDPKRSANIHNPLYNLVDDTPAIEAPQSATTAQVITHPQSGWLDGCEQSQGLPIC